MQVFVQIGRWLDLFSRSSCAREVGDGTVFFLRWVALVLLHMHGFLCPLPPFLLTSAITCTRTHGKEGFQRITRMVTGELRVNGVAAKGCDLQLKAEDANLVKTLLHKQRDLLTDLGFNVWCVDFWQPGCSKRLDLLGDFSSRRNFGVEGRAWVELKVFSDATFHKEVEHWKAQLKETLLTESQRDASLRAVLLLAAKVTRTSGGRWGAPTLHAMLLVSGSEQWLDLAGARRAARGQAKGAKPPLAKLWGKMEWHQTQGGQSVGLLKHFLASLRLPLKNAGQRARTLNGNLRQAGKTGRLVQTRLKSKAGREPWVASRQTFRDLYQCL